MARKKSQRELLAEQMNKLNKTVPERNIDNPMAGAFERVFISGDQFTRLDPNLPSAPDSYLRELQDKMERDEGYTPAPRRKHTPKPLRWQDFTYDLVRAQDNPNKSRLDYWFDRWSRPTGDKGYGSRITPQRIFFAILAEEGLRREDFDWRLFRERYFKFYPSQYPVWQEHEKERKQNG